LKRTVYKYSEEHLGEELLQQLFTLFYIAAKTSKSKSAKN